MESAWFVIVIICFTAGEVLSATRRDYIHDCNDASAKAHACTILKEWYNYNITIATRHASGISDFAHALANIYYACYGHSAELSSYNDGTCRCAAPGGYVCLDSRILRYILRLQEKFGMIKVNEIAGGCHSCTSSHYRGLAVDIDDSTNSTAMVQECWNMGGSYAADEKTHIHCNFA